jgi:hypothetical protein
MNEVSIFVGCLCGGFLLFFEYVFIIVIQVDTLQPSA